MAATTPEHTRLAILGCHLAHSSSSTGSLGVAAAGRQRGGRGRAAELGPLSQQALAAQSAEDAALVPADGLQAGSSNLIAHGVVRHNLPRPAAPD